MSTPSREQQQRARTSIAGLLLYLIVKGFKPSPILDDARCTGAALAPQ